MGQSIQEWTKQNLWKTAFKNLKEYALGRPYTFKFFEGCLSQILLGPFLNTLSQMLVWNYQFVFVKEIGYSVIFLLLIGLIKKIFSRKVRYLPCSIQ